MTTKVRFNNNVSPYVRAGYLAPIDEKLRKEAIDDPDEMGTALPSLNKSKDKKDLVINKWKESLEEEDEKMMGDLMKPSSAWVKEPEEKTQEGDSVKTFEPEYTMKLPNDEQEQKPSAVEKLKGDIDEEDADLYKYTGESEAERLPTLDEPKFTIKDAARIFAPKETLFSKLMNTEKPMDYASAMRRYGNADMARRHVMFAGSNPDSKAQYDKWNQVAMDERQRQQAGEENELQRRTTAENMWGHYSPAITQAITNSTIFTQKSYQLQEEADKLETTARNEAERLAGDQNVLSAEFMTLKDTFFRKFDDIPKDAEWFINISRDPEASEALIRRLAGTAGGKQSAQELRSLLAKQRDLNAQQLQLREAENEAQRKRNEAEAAMRIAGVNSAFAKRGHEAFGFPALSLDEIKSITRRDDNTQELRGSKLADQARYGSLIGNGAGREGQGDTESEVAPVNTTSTKPNGNASRTSVPTAPVQKPSETQVPNEGASSEPTVQTQENSKPEESQNKYDALVDGTDPHLSEYLLSKASKNPKLAEDARRSRSIKGMNSSYYATYDLDALNQGTKNNEDRGATQIFNQAMADDLNTLYADYYNFYRQGKVSPKLGSILRENKKDFSTSELLRSYINEVNNDQDRIGMQKGLQLFQDRDKNFDASSVRNLENTMYLYNIIPNGWRLQRFMEHGKVQVGACPPGTDIVEVYYNGEMRPMILPIEVARNIRRNRGAAFYGK